MPVFPIKTSPIPSPFTSPASLTATAADLGNGKPTISNPLAPLSPPRSTRGAKAGRDAGFERFDAAAVTRSFHELEQLRAHPFWVKGTRQSSRKPSSAGPQLAFTFKAESFAETSARAVRFSPGLPAHALTRP